VIARVWHGYAKSEHADAYESWHRPRDDGPGDTCTNQLLAQACEAEDGPKLLVTCHFWTNWTPNWNPSINSANCFQGVVVGRCSS